MKYSVYIFMLTIAAGCGQKEPEASLPTLQVPVVNQAGRIIFPAKVERPAELNWKPATNGIELATWSMDEWPFVFCAVRNPTDAPIKYPGGCGLGWWEFTSIFARNKDSAEWIIIPIRPVSPHGVRVVTGAGPISMDLAPGQEFRASMPSRVGGPRVSLVDRNFSFYVDMTEYVFPDTLTGLLEIKIESLGYEFPASTLPIETIRKFGAYIQ